MNGEPSSFVSVRIAPIGRAHDIPAGRPGLTRSAGSGDQIVVQTEGGQALGTVTQTIPVVASRRQAAAESPNRVVRRATPEDVGTRARAARIASRRRIASRC